MKYVVAVFNQEKALVGAFSVIVQLRRLMVNSSSHDTIAAAGRGSLHSADHRTATMRGWELELSPGTKTETFFSLFLAARL